MGNDSIGRLNALASTGPSIFARLHFAKFVHCRTSNFVIELEFMLLGRSENKQSGRGGINFSAFLATTHSINNRVIYKCQSAIKDTMLRFIDFSRSIIFRRGVPQIVIEIHGGQK